MSRFFITALIAAVALWVRSFILSSIDRAGMAKNVNEKRLFYVRKAVDSLFIFLCLVVVLGYNGMDVDDLGVFLGSFIAVLGVSLFAQWSILSNVTASVFIFFFFPYRVGDHIRIVDGDNSLAGVIKEIALFHVILTGEDDALLTFPTSLIFQRAVTVKPAKLLEPEPTEVIEQKDGDAKHE